MELQDKLLHCARCGIDFLFTAGEQQFYLSRQFRFDPKHCKKCKIAKRNEPRPRPQISHQPFSRRPSLRQASDPNKIITKVFCASCGQKTTVPFRPTQGRPVLCRACYMNSRNAASA